jgi:hypothetical protein
MGQALWRRVGRGGARREPALDGLSALRTRFSAVLAALLLAAWPAAAQQTESARRFDAGRFTVVAYPGDATLARSLLEAARQRDTFPGLPRPEQRVLIAIAPDRQRFREWIGPSAPEWGAAVAFPASRRIVMQGHLAGSDAGDPIQVLRHELAHLALHERLGDLPPRWFDEGYASYAAGEWGRDEVLATNLALTLRGPPTLAALDSGFAGGSIRADAAYALSYRAVAELAALDPQRGLTLFFRYWKETGSFDQAVRRAYGMTADAFEKQWATHTRRRYGALALVTDVSLVALVFTVLLGPLYIARLRRQRRRMRALLRADEEAERRERESAIEALLRSLPSSDVPPGETSGGGTDREL